MYPAISITAAGGVNAFKASNWFSVPASLFGTVAGGITAPLFNGKRLKTAYELSKVDQEKTVILFRQAVLKAVGEVSDALAQYKNETTKLAIREQQVDALTKAADYSDELLEYGMVNYLEVLTAKDNALNSQLNLIDNKYRQYEAIINLYRALGGGWK